MKNPRRSLSGTAAACALLMLSGVFLAPSAAASLPPSGVLTVTNPDSLPSNSSVLFNRIQIPADSYQRFHDKVSVRLTNTGTTTLTVNTLSTTGPFTVASPYALPFRLPVGAGVNVPITFTAQYGAWYSGLMSVNSTSTTGEVKSVALTGYWQKYSEHNLEPWLPDLVKKLGYQTVMPTGVYSRGAYQAFSADEVLSPYWTVMNSAASVRLTELAAWHGYPSAATVKTFAKGSSTVTSLVFTGLKNDSQSAFPRNSVWGRGTTTFARTGTFGLVLDSEFSDAALNDQTVDRASGCTATLCGQHVRVFRARDSAGVLVSGSYLLAEDIGGINYDYQDNVYLLENVRPAA